MIHVAQVLTDDRVRIKLCGLKTREQVQTAAALGADYVGLVLAPSRRQVSVRQARELIDDLAHCPGDDELAAVADSPHPLPVLVVMNLDEASVRSAAQATGASHVQLCGDETPETCARLRSSGLTVWKAWGVRGDARDEAALAYFGAIDALLLDRYAGDQGGGTGLPFDWARLAFFRDRVPELPLVVAGGLQAATVGPLLAHLRPFAVDVSSGIETDGVKDVHKMRRFVEAVRSCGYVSG